VGYIVVLMFFFSFSFLKLICVRLALCMCISFLPQMPVLLLCIVLHGNFFLDIMKCYLFIHSVFKFLIAREHFDCFVHWYWMQIQRTDSSFRIFAYFFSPPSAHSPNLVLSSATSTSGLPVSPGEGSHHLWLVTWCRSPPGRSSCWMSTHPSSPCSSLRVGWVTAGRPAA